MVAMTPGLIFSAFSSATGRELYRLGPDGAVERVADINAGQDSSNPNQFTEVNGTLYFQAEDAAHGKELYRMTAEGSVGIVRDIRPGPDSGMPFSLSVVDDDLYFSANDGSTGNELYSVEGSGAVKMVSDLFPGPGSAAPLDFFAFGSALYFNARTEGDGAELRRSYDEGRSAQLVHDIAPGNGSSMPGDFVPFNNAVYFNAFEPAGGRELYRLSSGGDVVRLADLNPGSGNSAPSEFTEFNGNLYFTATPNGFSDRLYSVSGTGLVRQVSDIVIEDEPDGAGFTEFGGALYFRGDRADVGEELFRVTQTGSIELAADIEPGFLDSDPYGFTEFGGALYFAAMTRDHGREVHRLKADGSVERVSDINSGLGSAHPEDFVVYGDTLYFSATDGSTGRELYRIGADGAVSRVADINPGSGGSDPEGFVVFPPPVPMVGLSAADAAGPEGDPGDPGTFTFTLTRSQVTDVTTIVTYVVRGDGDAPADADDFEGLAFPSGALTFAPGETTRTLSVSMAGDDLIEPDEGFVVRLTSISGDGIIVTATATGLIENDDEFVAPRLSIAAGNAEKSEGDGGTTAFTFTVTREGDTGEVTTVDYAVAGSGDDPADGADFEGGAPPAGTLSFAAGETTRTLTVEIAGDTEVEPDEGFTVTLANPSGPATIAQATASGTIGNDDEVLAPMVSVAADRSGGMEGKTGSKELTFMVIREGDTSMPISVDFAVSGVQPDPAEADDFVGDVFPAGTLEFAAHETEKTISVPVKGDELIEADEYFQMLLSDPSDGVEIATGSAQGMIQNDDHLAVPTDEIDQVTVVQSGIVGGGAIDNLYTIPANPDLIGPQVSISDTSGTDFIHLFAGIEIELSEVASETARLTLTTGEQITILGADRYIYLVGGNPLSGDWGTGLTYEQFVDQALGIQGGVPEDGLAIGGPVTIGEGGGGGGGFVDLNADPDMSVTGTAAAETFSLDLAAARISGFQGDIFDFDTAADAIRLNVEGTPAGIDTLEDLDGLDLGGGEEAAVQSNEITGDTLINLGLDRGGNLVTINLFGVDDPGAVDLVLA